MLRLLDVDVYLLWHMRPLEGQEDLDPEMDHIETAVDIQERRGAGDDHAAPARSRCELVSRLCESAR